MVTYESQFPVTKRDARQRVYRRTKKRLSPNFIRNKGDKTDAHAWGAISWMGKCKLFFKHHFHWFKIAQDFDINGHQPMDTNTVCALSGVLNVCWNLQQ